ncbi:MAG: UDP-N-acetylmuramoyl-L-alanyl-D-glutamate--2,6-diaminopimelate ligase [Rickettsia sp.]|nr:UDP-N-acetylmuramoyl-L-alanyl-D-glutamate--2,6-diaminopimelate ligase [Rickettsia sp.]
MEFDNKIETNNNLLLKNFFIKYNIKNIAYGIDDVTCNTVFFAIHGLTHNGNDFISEALEKNVNLIFTDNKLKENPEQNVFFIADIKSALMRSLEILYPDIPSKLIAVTGTNGKTSIVSYVGQMLNYLEISYICIGTLGIESNLDLPLNLKQLHDGNTVPNSINFRKILYEAHKLGIQYIIFEISSHAIDQKRIGNILVNGLGFSSFSQDHLDYHKTIESYLNTKLSFIKSNLHSQAKVVIYNDNIYSKQIVDFCKKNDVKFITIGKNADIQISTSSNKHSFFQKITFTNQKKNYEFETKILGNFQAHNILIASQLIENVVNIKIKDLFKIFSNLKTVNSRLENITEDFKKNNKFHLDFHIFIDYAHTPDALRLTLLALKKFIKNDGKLIVIFGCGGEKDVSKRPIMGKMASEIADLVVITDDNPREENPESIRKAIIETIQNKQYKEYDSRKNAIEKTIATLKADDILLIAGKGNENFQIMKQGKKIFFNDKQIAISCLSKLNQDLDKIFHLSQDFSKNTTKSFLVNGVVN